MANQQAPGRFIIDTPSTNLIAPQAQKIKSIDAPGAVTILDKNDVLLWQCTVARSYFVEQWWWDGFKVTALAGGTLLIYTETC